MKKIIFILIALTFSGISLAQTKQQVAKFINETNSIIAKTAKIVKAKQVYTGGIVKAIEFQEKAYASFNNNQPKKALNASYVARRLTFYAHQKNINKPIPQPWRVTPQEKGWLTQNVTNAYINKVLSNANKDKDRTIIVKDILEDVQ